MDSAVVLAYGVLATACMIAVYITAASAYPHALGAGISAIIIHLRALNNVDCLQELCMSDSGAPQRCCIEKLTTRQIVCVLPKWGPQVDLLKAKCSS